MANFSPFYILISILLFLITIFIIASVLALMGYWSMFEGLKKIFFKLFPIFKPKDYYWRTKEDDINEAEMKTFINKLQSLNYFSFSNNDDSKQFLNTLQLNARGLNFIIPNLSDLLFQQDKRSFLINFSDCIVIDYYGVIDEDDGYLRTIEREQIDIKDFSDFLQKLGLDFNLAYDVLKDENQKDIYKYCFTINNHEYTHLLNHQNEEFVAYYIANDINKVLSKTAVKERVYLNSEVFPTLIIFLTDEQFALFSQLPSSDDLRLLNCEQWKAWFEDKYNLIIQEEL